MYILFNFEKVHYAIYKLKTIKWKFLFMCLKKKHENNKQKIVTMYE